jgi:hypothetical protein
MFAFHFLDSLHFAAGALTPLPLLASSLHPYCLIALGASSGCGCFHFWSLIWSCRPLRCTFCRLHDLLTVRHVNLILPKTIITSKTQSILRKLIHQIKDESKLSPECMLVNTVLYRFVAAIILITLTLTY